MKVKDIIKKQTTIVVIAVLLVTITVIGVSYAIFFDVGKNTNNQVIKAGTLELTLEGITALNVSEPVTQTVGLTSTPVSYKVKNTGDLPASYKIYLYADDENTVSLNNIKISTDGTTAKTLTSITPETVDSKTAYPIDEGNVEAEEVKAEKKIRVWVDEESITEAAENQKVSLNMYIVSEVKE